jgi:hypothetical protein
LVDGDLVERVVEGEATPCLTLDLWFVLAPARLDGEELALRLAHDERGDALIPTPIETERATAERERAEKERERAEKERALARVAELEAELGRRPPR